MWLKQSTAATIVLGPFVDSTDGVTPETGLSITQAETRLSKNGGAFAQKNDANTATHDEEGNYAVGLSSTDTNTLGRLRVSVYIAGALPVWLDVEVVPANVWDSIFGADALQVHAVEISNALITAASIAADAITDAKVAADVTIASVTGAVGSVTGNVTGSVGSVATGGISSASFAAGAIDNAALAANAIGASELAADAIDEILDETIGDSTITMRQALRLSVAALAGKLSGAATTTVTIRNIADDTDRITATVDADGNRSAVTVSV